MYLILKAVILNLLLIISFTFAKEVEEFCNSETFKASCPNNQVVVINSAKYGRMSVGKCISNMELEAFGAQINNRKYLGCFKDVTKKINEKCNLESYCEMKVTDLESMSELFCLPGLKMHLEVDFSCLSIFKDNGECEVAARNTPVYLSHSSFLKNGASQVSERECLTKHKPLEVVALNGQRIKLSLKRLDRSREDVDRDSLLKEPCTDELGYIFGGPMSLSNATICSSAFKVQTGKTGNPLLNMNRVFETNENHLSLYFSQLSNPLKFLIKVEADGCSNIIPHEDSWMKRNNDDLVVGCFMSPKRWYLKCENRQWKGVFGNCSEFGTKTKIVGVGNTQNGKPEKAEVIQQDIVLKREEEVVVLAALCAVGVIICLAIVCFGCICFKKCGSAVDNKNISIQQPPTYYSHGQYNQPLFHNHQASNNHPTIGNNNTPHDNALNKEDDNKYFVLEADK